MKKILFLSVCFFSLSSWALTAQLSSNEVQQGQSVELILSSDQPIPNVDFSPLAKDFMLGGQSTGQSSQFINGVGSTTYEKSIVLFPVKEGKLDIPILNVGTEKTTPLTLNVQKMGTNSNKASNHTLPAPDIQLKASVSDKTPYVGQSIFYTLNLINANQLASAEIIPSGAEGIKLSNIGQDTETIKNNQRIIERKYLIKPEQSGKISVQPALLNGEIFYAPQKRLQGHGLFSMLNDIDFMGGLSSGMRPIQIASNSIELTVKPKPQNWEGWWLPTTLAQLKLTPEVPQNLKTGDTFRVSLTLSALNIDSNDLPVPKFSNDSHFRYYPEPEERLTSINSDGNLKSEVKVTYSIMPLEAGTLHLPEVKIPWFNVKTGQTEQAISAPLTLQVAEGNIAPLVKPALPIEQKIVEVKQENILKSKVFWWSICGAFIFGILIAGILFLIFKRKPQEKKKEKPIPDFYPF